ncbi:MAG: DUF1036 domain-containing protein [Rhizobiales bacterium]|nr:DUF1036 domain-containing protein [Hyphomicrobiales bacterium]
MQSSGGFWRVVLTVACLGLAAGLAGVFAASPARADLRLCNKTDSKISVAIGYKAEIGWRTEGWWNFDPRADANGCKVLLAGPLHSRFYYVYAIDISNGGEWGGEALLCTRQKEFTIDGIKDCIPRGYEQTGFFEVDTGEQESWTIQLTDPQKGGS